MGGKLMYFPNDDIQNYVDTSSNNQPTNQDLIKLTKDLKPKNENLWLYLLISAHSGRDRNF